MLIINKPRLPPIHLNRPTAAFEPDSAAPRLVLRLQWACFGGLVGRLGLLMIVCADDADAALDDTAGELIFMARTCVQENVGDFCSTGVKSGTQTAVTVCRSDL